MIKMLADPSAALHAGKDLAVSPERFPVRLSPKGLLHFRSGRLCSHLASHNGRALPATVLQKDVFGLSSPALQQERSSCRQIIQHNKLKATTWVL